MGDLISIIVPCYNEAEAVPYFYDAIEKQAAVMRDKYGIDFEYIFIDDGSHDDTLTVLKAYAEKDSRVKYISFSRNFGKEAAMYAGLEASRGDYTAIMDADLQDPPYMLSDMYEAVKNEGYDCAATRRVSRKGEPMLRSFFARRFYKIMSKISKADIADGARDYRLMSRKVVDAILAMEEYNRFSKGIFGWIGFKTKWLEFENTERVAGETKWSFWKLFLYSLDGITAFSTMPLAIASVIGMLFCIIAFILIMVIIVKTLVFGDPVAGYPSLVCIIFFVAGVQTFCVGIVGQYLAKTYLETKKRPIYIIRETNGGIKI
ncbi:MAG: glycosyltransferase family 2 protein [Clostridia bacterium]|nr:glycosyltransferase family 2 protein [Clostridia bacterium]